MKIEPITGSTLAMVQRIQWNTYLQSSVTNAPRIRPFNISYLEDTTSAPTRPFPILWMETNVAATAADLGSFDSVKKL